MATKKLSRTVTEGGRQGRDMERYSTKSERQEARLGLHRIERDSDEAWDNNYHHRRVWQETNFSDRLRPVERYLQSQAGRPWDKVFSELCRKFDRRTLKGWHLIDGHVNRSMVHKPGNRYLFGGYTYPPPYGAWVDRNGILRYTERKKRWFKL